MSAGAEGLCYAPVNELGWNRRVDVKCLVLPADRNAAQRVNDFSVESAEISGVRGDPSFSPASGNACDTGHDLEKAKYRVR